MARSRRKLVIFVVVVSIFFSVSLPAFGGEQYCTAPTTGCSHAESYYASCTISLHKNYENPLQGFTAAKEALFGGAHNGSAPKALPQVQKSVIDLTFTAAALAAALTAVAVAVKSARPSGT